MTNSSLPSKDVSTKEIGNKHDMHLLGGTTSRERVMQALGGVRLDPKVLESLEVS